jgi:uncharacterized membrane protein YqiK
MPGPLLFLTVLLVLAILVVLLFGPWWKGR